MAGGFLLDDPWSIDAADFPRDSSQQDKLLFLLNYAVLAPSVLGTEPWRFHVSENSVLLRADLERKLPVTDPKGRELLISCGAALLNLRIAAASSGHELNVTIFPDERRPELVAEATLGLGAGPAFEHQLCGEITKRRTNRGAFVDRPLPEDLADRLMRAARQEGAMLSVLGDPKAQRNVLELAGEARRAQLAAPAYRSELARWVQRRIAEARDHDSEARHRLGLDLLRVAGGTPKPLDLPELGTPKAAGFARLLAGGADTEKGHAHPGGTSILALLTTPADSRESWVIAGQALQRVLLVAAAAGVSASYVNAPIETTRLRQRLARAFHVNGSPQVMLQLGIGSQRPPTPRRPMREVVDIGS